MVTTIEGALGRLEILLQEERGAIAVLDADRVARIAAEKEALFSILETATEPERRAFAPRLHALAPALRHNGVLLAHARDCLRDALATMAGEMPALAQPRGNAPTVPAPRRTRLSVTG
jgi:hypothetical protein